MRSRRSRRSLKVSHTQTSGTLNNHDVERVQVTKFLGVIIDKKLTWKYHLAHMSDKINKNISLSIKERNL